MAGAAGAPVLSDSIWGPGNSETFQVLLYAQPLVLCSVNAIPNHRVHVWRARGPLVRTDVPPFLRVTPLTTSVRQHRFSGLRVRAAVDYVDVVGAGRQVLLFFERQVVDPPLLLTVFVEREIWHVATGRNN